MNNFKLEFAGKELIVEIRNLAEQANGEVLVQLGETLVLATAVMSKEEKEEMGFFPLTVEYEERYYAAGKIRGPRYIKRETRPSDEAIINARLIDRAIRPRFPETLSREVQVIVTVLSWDGKNDPDVVGLLAASIALSISDIPWSGPLAALRIGFVENNFVINPIYQEREKSSLDLVFSGLWEGKEILINMIDLSGEEVSEDFILDAIEFSKEYLIKLIDFQKEIIEKVGKEKISLPPSQNEPGLEKEMKEFLGQRLEQVLYQGEKKERLEEVNQLKEELIYFIEEKYPGRGKFARKFFEQEIKRLIHHNIIWAEKRPDGRKLDQMREIYCEAGLIPRTHGSGLFCRGQTKALSILTLGAPGDQQLLEGMEIVGKKRFMHHYNFPPYSVGEIKPLRGPARREIGHGMLVEKALLPLIPSFDQFPYTMRVVSEILSSNGSTSMASVSSSSLALMDAGVPIKAPAAGIALGLMKEGKHCKILTDIQGPEDHHGDMDLKVAGTKKGITAIQMDVKIEGINQEIFREALEQAKKSRLEILDLMEKVLPEPRPHLSPFAPRILTIQINPYKIREVIGPGGRTINEIIAETGVAIDIQPTGLIFVTSESEEAAKKAISWIKNITREIKVGEIFEGRVNRILDFGAFVEILPGQEGLVHISQLRPFGIKKVRDFLKVGDLIPVKVISIDDQGRINLGLRGYKKTPKTRRRF